MIERIERFEFQNGVADLVIDDYGYFIDNPVCIASKDIIDEEDAHYFRTDCKILKNDSEVKLIRVYQNLYGTYLYVLYNDIEYCVKSKDLIFKKERRRIKWRIGTE